MPMRGVGPRVRDGAGDASRTDAALRGFVLYREDQSLGWPMPGMFLGFLCVVTIASVGIPFGYGMWMQLVLGRPWGDHPMSDGVLLTIGPVALLASLLTLNVLFARLIVEVRTDGISIRLTRLGGRLNLRRDEVHAARLVRMGALEVGRAHKWRRRVYRLAGSEGVELQKTKGSGTVVVSSEHPQTLLRAVRSMLEPEPGR